MNTAAAPGRATPHRVPTWLLVPSLICSVSTVAAASPLAGRWTALAQTPAASFSLPQTPFGGGLTDGTDAYEFIPTTDIYVTALGWYDQDGDGLVLSHPVGIFDVATKSLVTPPTTVLTTSPLDTATNFRYVALPQAVHLSKGTTYSIAGHADGPPFDPYVYAPTGGVQMAADVTYVRYSVNFGTTFAFPNLAGSTNPNAAFFGPNFQYTRCKTIDPHIIGEHVIAGDVICDNQFAIFTSAKESASMALNYSGYTKSYPGTLPVELTTTDRYLYIACWSDDTVAQGLLHDLTVDGVPVFSGDPRWKVTHADSDQEPYMANPEILAPTMAATIPAPPGGWVVPAVGCANPPVGQNCYGLWGHWPLIDLAAHWIWYDSGAQIAPNAPFTPGFNHGEFLIFRLDMGFTGMVHKARPGELLFPLTVDGEPGTRLDRSKREEDLLFVLATGPDAVTQDPAGRLLVNRQALLGAFSGRTPIRVPNNPALVGMTLYGQNILVHPDQKGPGRVRVGPTFEIRIE